MIILRNIVGVATRIGIAAICALAMWNSWKIARADHLARRDDEQSLRKAITLVPDNWEYYMGLADLDQDHARELLNTSLRMDRYNALANIELGWQSESEGDYAGAEKSLLAAFDVDRTYPPRWNLAEYYFRRNNLPAFWSWARSAADMPADDIEPLFELCWEVAPDPEMIAHTVLGDKPQLMHQYTDFLLGKDQLDAAAMMAQRLVHTGTPDGDRPLLFSTINQLAAANDGLAANALWHSLIDQHWVIADNTTPNNGQFVRDPLSVSFDWSLPQYSGLHSWPGPGGLETEFSGSQPEDCIIAEQVVMLAPGNYTMDFAYHTADILPDTGIHWEIIDASSNAVIANSTDLSSPVLKSSSLSFSVPPGASLLKLRLGYQRALGTPRVSGSLVVLSSDIKANL